MSFQIACVTDLSLHRLYEQFLERHQGIHFFVKISKFEDLIFPWVCHDSYDSKSGMINRAEWSCSLFKMLSYE